MKIEPLLGEIETVKEQLADDAGGDTARFLEQMDAWLDAHPHPGPILNSAEELRARVRAREAQEAPQPSTEPYRIHDPIIAEIHRTREKLQRLPAAETPVLREDPPSPGDSR